MAAGGDGEGWAGRSSVRGGGSGSSRGLDSYSSSTQWGAAGGLGAEGLVNDCWALEEDSSWLGRGGRGTATGERCLEAAAGGGEAGNGAVQRETSLRARELLRSAFAEGDVMLCLNTPPTWKPPSERGYDIFDSHRSTTAAAPGGGDGGGSGFASTRPGVLWNCWQVESQGRVPGGHSSSSSSDTSMSPPAEDTATAAAGAVLATAADGGDVQGVSANSGRRSSGSVSSSKSWRVDGADLYGRSLPSSSYDSSVPTGGNFVQQDNTQKVVEALQYESNATSRSSSRVGSSVTNASSWRSNRSQGSSTNQDSSSTSTSRRHGDFKPDDVVLPAVFMIQQGTVLSDHATSGDVEAVFSGRAAVTTLQTWPVGHPLCLRDEVMAAALDEGEGGMPAWLMQ